MIIQIQMAKGKGNGIEVYVRVRPSKKVDPQISLRADDDKIDFNLVKDRVIADGTMFERNHTF